MLPLKYFHPSMNPDKHVIWPFHNYQPALALRRMTFGAPASPCGCPCPQPSVGWLYCIYSLHVTTNSHCVRYRHYTQTHTYSLSHTNTCKRACTHKHISDVPVAPTVLWWRLRLFLFNGACISDAFDNHVHISELSWRRQQAKSDWLSFCLYFSWNKS